jgi:hypothetical protein
VAFFHSTKDLWTNLRESGDRGLKLLAKKFQVSDGLIALNDRILSSLSILPDDCIAETLDGSDQTVLLADRVLMSLCFFFNLKESNNFIDSGLTKGIRRLMPRLGSEKMSDKLKFCRSNQMFEHNQANLECNNFSKPFNILLQTLRRIIDKRRQNDDKFVAVELTQVRQILFHRKIDEKVYRRDTNGYCGQLP